MSHSPTVRAAVLTGFSALSRAHGLDPGALLRGAGLPLRVEEDPDRRLPTATVNRLLEQAASQAGTADFGLRLAELRGFANLGPVTVLARDEPDMQSALAVFIAYLPLHNEALTITLEQGSDLAVLACRVAGEGPRVQATDVAVAMLHRILVELLGPDWRPLAVHLERLRPVRVASFTRAFAAPVHFGQDFSGIVLDPADLERPNRLAQAALRPYAALLRASLPGGQDQSLAQRVARMLQAMLAGRRCTAALVAERLGLSRRSLDRHLAAEGTSFHALLDAARGELARAQLAGSRRSNTEIAELLGFSGAPAFTAWFSQRHGISPQAWRRRQERGK